MEEIKKTLFHIQKMDCPSEEALIRLKLDEVQGIRQLNFDIDTRSLSVLHTCSPDPVFSSLKDLNLGAEMVSSEESGEAPSVEHSVQRKALWLVLVIKLAFFLIEMLAGLASRSMGLVADSLDMLADAFVYSISLIAVGRTVVFKKNVAKSQKQGSPYSRYHDIHIQ